LTPPPNSSLPDRTPPATPRKSPILKIFTVLFMLFVAGGLYFGYIFIATATNVLSASLSLDWSPLPAPPIRIPGFSPDEFMITSRPPTSPTERPNTPAPGGRVTVLLLGLDQRDDERGNASRSDTMIVATMDPATKSGGMMSIPRDLWVAIPGYRDNKINVAHFLGDNEKLPGGGPALAKKTVELNFGIQVHYFLRVNFRGFEKLIDTLGGIDVDVPKYLVDYEYPTEDYDIMTIEFLPGMQHMNGVRALQYARTRHYDTDFGRNKRQMQVIAAARKKAIALDVLPKLPSLLSTVLANLDTDVPITAIPSLAKAAMDLDSDNIFQISVDQNMVQSAPGSTDLVPDRDDLRKLVATFLADPKVRAEEAKIEIQNGSGQSGVGIKAADFLRGQGFAVDKIANAPRNDIAETYIVDYSGSKTNTLTGLATALKIPLKNIRPGEGKSDYDLILVLGKNASNL
jgi:polyisoprenyl-teichoic acid--peptidoglycan teichoic acid transferase